MVLLVNKLSQVTISDRKRYNLKIRTIYACGCNSRIVGRKFDVPIESSSIAKARLSNIIPKEKRAILKRNIVSKNHTSIKSKHEVNYKIISKIAKDISATVLCSLRECIKLINKKGDNYNDNR
jgi:hypothetical protein